MPNGRYGEIEEAKPETLNSASETLLEISSFYAIQNKLIKIRYGTIDKRDEADGFVDPNHPPLKIPTHPPDVNIDANITKAKESFNPYWFIEMVKPKGLWDYKRRSPEYEDFGNFNFGATAKAFGFQEKWALQAAGIVQIYQHKARADFFDAKYTQVLLDFKEAFKGPPYGDESRDQEMIKLGFRYYDDVYMSIYGWKSTTKEDLPIAAQQVREAPFPLSKYIEEQLRKLIN